jgi:hypothetical protein
MDLPSPPGATMPPTISSVGLGETMATLFDGTSNREENGIRIFPDTVAVPSPA